MALCRCLDHPPANNRVKIYTHKVKPIGYPETSSICGIRGCEAAGFIWLTKSEYADYQGGEDVFTYDTNVTKVRVE